MPLLLKERFAEKYEIDRDTGCWNWIAAMGGKRSQYGRIWSGGRMRPAHRIAYELYVGVIPDGLHIDHLCRNTRCVNPAHLEPVTNRENLLRGDTLAAANAEKRHCAAGHEYTPENTRIAKRGDRRCRTCQREKAKAAYVPKPRALATHCKRGHEYTPENTYVTPSTGNRRCRACQAAYYTPRKRRFYKTHCKRGHEYTPENTYKPPGKPRVRMCRECMRQRNRKRRA